MNPVPTSPSKLPQLVKMLRPQMRSDPNNEQLFEAADLAGDRDKPGGVLYRLLQSSSSSSPGSEATGTDNPLLTSSSAVNELAWLIPAIIVGIFVMLGLAFACYLGVRRLELRMLQWCRVHCACCHCWGDAENERLLNGDMYDNLNQTQRKESVRLRDFRERTPSYGMTRDTSKHYVPRDRFNPFDLD